MEHRPRVKHKTPVVGLKYIHPQQIRGQHVVGELHAAVVQPQYRGHAVRQSGFAHPRHIFQQHMATRQYTGQKLLHHRFFAQNQGVELFEYQA